MKNFTLKKGLITCWRRQMDKPYVPIQITDNATIDDALAGNFKIDKIKGNTIRNVEEKYRAHTTKTPCLSTVEKF